MAMMVIEALALLKLKPGCKMATVKRAYYALAMKHHPDKCKNSKKSIIKMKKLNEAYSVCKKYFENKGEYKPAEYETVWECVDFKIHMDFGIKYQG